MKPITTFLWMLAGPIIWAAHFFSIYIAEALVCTSPTPSAEVMRVTVSLLTLTALALLATVIRSERGALASIGRITEPEDRNFLSLATLLLAFLSALSVFWAAIPSFLVPVCTFAPG